MCGISGLDGDLHRKVSDLAHIRGDLHVRQKGLVPFVSVNGCLLSYPVENTIRRQHFAHDYTGISISIRAPKLA